MAKSSSSTAPVGPMTITQSVMITNPGGVEAGITAQAGQDAITINGPAAANITLRGLTIQGAGAGRAGIRFVPSSPAGSVSTLNIVDSIIKDFSSFGIQIEPGASSTTFKVIVSDSFIIGNSNGVYMSANDGVTVFLSFYRTTVSQNSSGLTLHSGGSGSAINGLMVDSHVDNNTYNGISVLYPGSNLVMKHSTATSNGFGTSDPRDAYNYLSTLNIFEHNTIFYLKNSGIMYTDGTNNVVFTTGNALNKQDLQ